MTDKEAVERFEKAHFLQEQKDMIQDMENIRNVLLQNPVVISQVRAQIETVNQKHPENIIINKLVFPPQGNRVSTNFVPDDDLITDLIWKYYYLQAKQKGKGFEEFCNTMRRMAQEKQNGGTNQWIN